MSTVTGILGGALTLAALQLVLTSQNATNAYGAIATVPAAWLAKIMDAGIAAIPDHSVTAPASSATSSAAPTSAIVATSYPVPSSLPPPSSPPVLSV